MEFWAGGLIRALSSSVALDCLWDVSTPWLEATWAGFRELQARQRRSHSRQSRTKNKRLQICGGTQKRFCSSEAVQEDDGGSLEPAGAKDRPSKLSNRGNHATLSHADANVVEQWTGTWAVFRRAISPRSDTDLHAKLLMNTHRYTPTHWTCSLDRQLTYFRHLISSD